MFFYLPGTGPHTRGIISNIAEHDGSSKHSCRARIQFKMAIAIFTFGPAMKNHTRKLEVYIKIIHNFHWKILLFIKRKNNTTQINPIIILSYATLSCYLLFHLKGFINRGAGVNGKLKIYMKNKIKCCRF